MFALVDLAGVTLANDIVEAVGVVLDFLAGQLLGFVHSEAVSIT